MAVLYATSDYLRRAAQAGTRRPMRDVSSSDWKLAIVYPVCVSSVM